MYNILLFIYVLVCIALIGFILVQQGKGANAGASFGGGASGTMFGSAGATAEQVQQQQHQAAPAVENKNNDIPQ